MGDRLDDFLHRLNRTEDVRSPRNESIFGGLKAWRLKQFPAYLNGGIPSRLGMRESLRIDFPFMGAGMPKAYSRDLRERVITAVETGASRREAAERFEVSVASAVK